MSGYPRPAVPVGHVEPVPRRIRAELGGRTVLDTLNAVYVWEWPFYPQYRIPLADVADDVLVPEGDEEPGPLHHGTVRRAGLRVGQVERPGAAGHQVTADVPELVDTVRFEWAALDAWYEEDEEVFVHPRSPYVRVDAVRSRRTVRVELDGAVLAESSAPVMLFETGLPTRYYLDRTAVDRSRLRPSDTRTACPYKGRTSQYWSVRTDTGWHEDLAWSYEQPAVAVAAVAGLIAFYDEKVDVVVDGARQDRPTTHFA